MKKIQLTKNKVALVDDDMFEYLNQWKWYLNDNGYAVNKGKTIIRMHRLINNTPEGLFTDHINMDKLDNRRCNLRSVSKSENGINRLKPKNNRSGCKGVCFNKNANKWMAEIKVKPTKIYLGIYTNLEDAIKIRKEAERRYHVI